MTEAEIVSSINFPVAIREVAYLTGDSSEGHHWEEIKDRRAVVRLDTGEPLSIVSDQYKLIPYSQAIDPIIRLNRKYCGEFVNRSMGKRMNPIRVEGGGRRIWLETTFNHQIEIGKDVIIPRVVYGNSYDCSSAYRAIVGFYQVKCTNAGALMKPGMVLGMSHNNISMRHSGHGDIQEGQLENHLKAFLEGFGQQAASLRSLANMTVSKEKAEEIFLSHVGQRFSTKNPLAVSDSESGWSLYSRITNYLTIDYRGGQQPAERRAVMALQDILRLGEKNDHADEK